MTRDARSFTGPVAAYDLMSASILVGVCDSFVGNCVLHQRGKQGERLILERALAHQGLRLPDGAVRDV